MVNQEELQGLPDNFDDRATMTERLADQVRALRLELKAVPDGRSRRAEQSAIGLRIDAVRWQMHRLNPEKYKKV